MKIHKHSYNHNIDIELFYDTQYYQCNTNISDVMTLLVNIQELKWSGNE